MLWLASRRSVMLIYEATGYLHTCVVAGLKQRSQITSMFESEKLWAKGFTGAKVKMAVFDTGVRADHPHFRNIKVQ